MGFKYEVLEAYDKHYKLNKEEFSCYSKRELVKKYPDENYSVVGEIRGVLYNENKTYSEEISTVKIKNKEYIVECIGKNNKLLYSKYRYISVGEDKYVAVLRNRLPFLIIFLLLLVGIAVSGAVIASLTKKEPEKVVNKVLQIQPIEDEHIEPIKDDKSEKVEPSVGGGSVTMEYSLFANINLTTKEIEVFFKNPNESNHNVALTLNVVSGDSEIPLAKTGTIPPKAMIQRLTLLPEAESLLQEGKYNGSFKVDYYDPNTGEKAVIDSVIDDVKITVTK